MTGKIFINYRRGDDPGHTGRLFDRLQDVFDAEQLFMDVDNIAPGLDFVRVLNERVAECDIVLAVIGKGWINSRDANGNRRLDDPDDFVRIEITSALNQGKRVIPVLVGEAQMPRPEDLPAALQPLARRNAVRLTHERFRADTQGLIKAIQQGIHDIEAERQAQAEVARRAEAEEERKRQEEETARRLAEEERAAAERRRHQAEAKKRADAERAFAVSKRTGTIAALDAFLAQHAESPFVDEARDLREALVAREKAFRQSAASSDPIVLRSFIETYKNGADVRSVQARLRRLEPGQSRLPVPSSAIAAALAVILIAGGSLYWLKFRPPGASPRPISVVTNEALPHAENLTGGAIAEANSKVGPTVRAVDQIAWDLVKETTDENALKRFVQQYPDSALRKDAEDRIASLEAAEAAKVEAAAKAEAARAEATAKAEAARQAEVAARIAAANKALEEERAKAAAQIQQPANQQVAAAAQPGAVQGGETGVTGSALIQAIKMELTRVGCYTGKLDSDWTSPGVKQSIIKFVKAASLPRVPDDPSADFLSAVRSAPSRICPLECARTEVESNGKCIAKACPNGQSLDDNGNCVGTKQRAVSHSAPAAQPAVAGRSAPADTAPQGRGAHGAVSPAAIANRDVGIICGRFGCKAKAARPAPSGVPCAKAIQDRSGAWHCT
jgi:TIR domain